MKRFFALSRTTHGVLDLAAPGFTAVLWLGGFPQWQIILLSIFTAFAAYTAIYALNDLVGIAVDREKFADGAIKEGYSVEASDMRYPLAQNVLSYRSGLFWFAFWYIVALVGAYFLNPTIVFILIGAAILEVIYCLMLKVTYWRTLVSGLVKASGPIAAVFVVDSSPAPKFLLLLFAWVLFWEIGGQNVPADWNDTVEDRRVGAKTIPIRFGSKRAGLVVLGTLGLTVIISMFLPSISPLTLGIPYIVATVVVGFILLLLPGYRLYKLQDGRLAARLFDRASYYPIAQLVIVSVFAIFS
ncbi:MAG: UbiA family prenyltransferase [Deltaproteobacteria bacterium]|jgi:4-hydroxybenzoate polyprenyltransferase|nr:UbiA family prenyltransferase [Deltaproteobacteria bacterium]